MSVLIGLIASIGTFILNTFVSNLAKRAAMAKSWDLWIASRQARADQTVELKMNLDEQTADLDLKRKQIEHPTKPQEGK